MFMPVKASVIIPTQPVQTRESIFVYYLPCLTHDNAIDTDGHSQTDTHTPIPQVQMRNITAPVTKVSTASEQLNLHSRENIYRVFPIQTSQTQE